MSLPPALLLGFIFVAASAAVFHLWGGRSLRDLFAYLLAAGIGFGLGQLAGTFLQLPLPKIGGLHLLEGAIVAWLALFVTRALQTNEAPHIQTGSGRR